VSPYFSKRAFEISPSVALAFAIYVFFAFFLVYPLLTILIESVFDSNGFTFSYFMGFFGDRFYQQSMINSLLLAGASVITTSMIGIPLAYIMARFDIPFRSILMTMFLMPLIVPPFVGALAFVFLLGNFGTLNLVLMDWLGLIDKPINFIYGFHGLLLLETIHLFPLVLLNTLAALYQVDSSSEEAAEILGASHLRRFFTITLPLAFPGYAAGAILVFIYVLSDWLTPIVLRQNSFVAAQAYLNVAQFLDVTLVKEGLVASAVIAAFSIAAVVVMRAFVERKVYALSTRGFGSMTPTPIGSNRAVVVFVGAMFILVLLGPTWLGLAAFSRAWSLTPFPGDYTLENFGAIFLGTSIYLRNSLQFGLISAGLDILLGMSMAYLIAKTQVPGRNILDSIVTMVIAIPGIVLGIGYLRAFHGVMVPLLGTTLSRLWIIMPLVTAVRRVPYVVRSVHGSLLQLDPSLEEASEILGASKSRTFAKITLPTISRAVLVGGILSFITSLEEASATIFLYQPGWETMPIAIFIFFQSGGRFGQAAAIGFTLMLVAAVCVALANRLWGARVGSIFGG